jgi:hypothetical protein
VWVTLGLAPDAQAVRATRDEVSDEPARSRRPAVAAAVFFFFFVIIRSGADTPQESVAVGQTPGKLAAAHDA